MSPWLLVMKRGKPWRTIWREPAGKPSGWGRVSETPRGVHGDVKRPRARSLNLNSGSQIRPHTKGERRPPRLRPCPPPGVTVGEADAAPPPPERLAACGGPLGPPGTAAPSSRERRGHVVGRRGSGGAGEGSEGRWDGNSRASSTTSGENGTSPPRPAPTAPAGVPAMKLALRRRRRRPTWTPLRTKAHTGSEGGTDPQANGDGKGSWAARLTSDNTDLRGGHHRARAAVSRCSRDRSHKRL